MSDPSVQDAALPPGTVARAGSWTVARRRDDVAGDRVRAVSSRCRHQLADLSGGTVDRDGCLVCPWHGARYDLDRGRMVEGPKGFLTYVGRTPGYTQLVRLVGRVLPLRRRAVTHRDGRYVVGPS